MNEIKHAKQMHLQILKKEKKWKKKEKQQQ